MAKAKTDDLDDFAADRPQSTFLKWDDGPHVIRFDLPDDLRATRRNVHWIGTTPQDCPGPGCEVCASITDRDDPRRLKTSWVFDVVLKDGSTASLELSAKAKEALVPLLELARNQHGKAWKSEFSGQWWEARRKGMGRGIEYSFKPVAVASEKQDEIPF